MESVLTDARCKRIIETEMIPSFKKGDYFQGIDNAATVVMGLLLGLFVPDDTASGVTSDIWIAIFNFLVCAAVAIVVSLATAPPNELQLAGLTISTLSPEQRQANRDSYSKLDVAISLLLAVIVISILIYFRG